MFWAPGQQEPNFDGFIYSHYAAPPYSARISAIYLLPFGKVWLGSVRRVQRPWQRSRTQNFQNLRKVGEIPGPIFTYLWIKVHEIFRRCRRLFVLSNTLARLSIHVWFRRYSPLSLEIVETEQMLVFFAPNFWEGMIRRFCGSDYSISAIYCPPLSNLADLRQGSLAMK